MARNKEYELAIKIAGEVEKSFYNSTKLTKKELKALAKSAARTAEESKAFRDGIKDVGPIFGGIEKAGKAAFEAVAAGATLAAGAVGGVVAASVSAGSSFEKQMSDVAAISGATRDEVKSLGSLAKELGATTQFTASEVGGGMEYMAMAGWKTKEMLEGMGDILNLAAAAGEDLGTTADIVTDAMTAFGMAASEVGRFGDVLAATATNSNTTVSMMGEAFSYAAPLAGALGYSIEDVALATGLMANSGIKASNAGTALRKFFSDTANGIKISSKALGDYEIQTAKSDGSMRALRDIMVDLREAFAAMTEQEKSANAESLVGKTGMSGLLAIVNASEKDFNKLSESINGCAGATEAMAGIRLDNLAGDVTIFQSAVEGLGVQIYEDLSGPLRDAMQWATGLAGAVSQKLGNSNLVADIVSAARENLPTALRHIQEFAGGLREFSGPLFDVGRWLSEHPDTVKSFLVGIGSALATYKVASGIASLSKSFGALAGILTNPFAIGILAVAAAIGGAAGIAYSIKKCAEEAKKANLAAHFGGITLSLEELQDVAGHIVSNDSLGGVREAMGALEDLEGIQDGINDSVKALGRMNWKVSIGMGLGEGEQASYISEIGDFVDSCNEALEQKRFAVSIAVGALTDKDLEGYDIVTKINSFYSGKQQELADLGTRLNETVTGAFTDGLLDIDEAKEIAELQNQMAELQRQLAGSQFGAKMEVLQMQYNGVQLDPETFQNLQAEIGKLIEDATGDYNESLTLAISNAKLMLDDGAINQQEYASMVQEFKENYLENIGDLQLKAQGFQLDTIYSAYGEELGKAGPQMREMWNQCMKEAFSDEYAWEWQEKPALMWNDMLQKLASNEYLDESTKAAVSALVKPLLGQMEATKEQFVAAGMEVPESIAEGMEDAAMLGALVGDVDSMYALLGDRIKNSEKASEVIGQAREAGMMIPDEVAEAIGRNKGVAKTAVESLYSYAQQCLSQAMGRGFDVNTEIRLTTMGASTQGGTPSRARGVQVFPHAAGGIFSTPHVGLVAEAGAEALIPLDGSQNARDIWRQSGQILGQKSKLSSASEQLYGSGGQTQFVFSPSMNFYGDAPSQDTIEAAMENEQDKFERQMEQWMRRKGRVSFAG